MPTLRWIGNAADVAQVVVIEVANVEIGDKFRITCNNKYVEVTATAATVANVIDLFVEAFLNEDSTLAPELAELTAEAFTDELDNVYKLRLTSTAGVPFTVTVSKTNAGTFGVLVETIQHGGGGVSEIKQVTLAGIPTGGTFTLTLGGQTTAAQPYNETDANLEADLEALSSIGAGNVSVARTGSGVAGDPYIWTLTFQAALANQNIGGLTGNGASLTGAGEILHETIQEGGSANEIQTITHPTSDSGTYSLVMETGTFSGFSSGMSGAAMEAVFDGILGAGSTTISRETSGSDYVYTIQWTGTYGNTDRQLLDTQNTVGTVNNIHATVQDGGGSSQNEIQRFTILNGAVAGTYTLTTDDGTTGNITHPATAGTVQTALEALTTAGDYSVSRTGSGTVADPYTYEVEFTGALALTDVSQMTSVATSLTGAEVLSTTPTQGSAGQNEIQRVTLTGTPTAGTFDLTNDYGAGDETATIDFDATALEFRAELEGLATPVAGDFTVTGAAGGPWTVTYQGAFAATDFDPFTGDATNLAGTGTETITATTTVDATGKHFWDNDDNWDTGTAPTTADTVYIQNSDVSIKYGLAQSGETLAALYIDMSFEGQIGLPDYTETGYFEYRAKELAISSDIIRIGDGEGPGSSLIRINTGANAVVGTQVNSGVHDDEALTAVQWRGTSSDWIIIGGEFGAALAGGQVATIGSLDLGLANADEPEANLYVKLGRGVSLTTYNQYGGFADIYCDVGGHFLGRAGVTALHDDAGVGGNVSLHGGRLNWEAESTIAGTCDVGSGGILDATKDPRAKVITGVCRLHTGFTFLDRQRTITFTANLQTVNCGIGDGLLDLGRHREYTVANI